MLGCLTAVCWVKCLCSKHSVGYVGFLGKKYYIGVKHIRKSLNGQKPNIPNRTYAASHFNPTCLAQHEMLGFSASSCRPRATGKRTFLRAFGKKLVVGVQKAVLSDVGKVVICLITPLQCAECFQQAPIIRRSLPGTMRNTSFRK